MVFELVRCRAVFVPGDPARTGGVAFWHPYGADPPPADAGSVADLEVAPPVAGGVEQVTVPASVLPVRAALPVLTRARVSGRAHRATAFWGAASVLALVVRARGPAADP